MKQDGKKWWKWGAGFAVAVAVTFHFPAELWAKGKLSKIEQIESEFSKEEASRQIEELLELGDTFVERRDFNRAIEAYEQVFVLDPANTKASAKIDVAKKQMMREGHDETGVVTKVYDEEIRERLRRYWSEAREYLQQEKFGQARLALEKILLLDPMNQEARKLYDSLTSQLPQKNQ